MIRAIIFYLALILFLLHFSGCKKNNVNVTPTQPVVIHEEVGTIESHHIVYTTNTTFNQCICSEPIPQPPEIIPVNPILIQINNQSYVCYTLNDSYNVMQNVMNLYFYSQQLQDYINHICSNNLSIENNISQQNNTKRCKQK